jgi:hypothetical protein
MPAEGPGKWVNNPVLEPKIKVESLRKVELP